MNQQGSVDRVDNGAIEAELARIKAAYATLLDRQSRIMALTGSTDADRLIHDIRNILNERELLRALADIQK